jgi:hypothetical protein
MLKQLRGTWRAEWELSLPNDDATRSRFANDDILDILFVLTYSGRTLEWQP